jgi:hypothetical protein
LAAKRANTEREAGLWDEVYGTSEDRGVVVLGDPGLGKTWLLHYEALRATRRALEELNRDGAHWSGVVPVFATCKKLAALSGSVTDRVCQHLASLELGRQIVETVTEAIGGPHGLRLFLDSWDEVAAPTAAEELGAELGTWLRASNRHGKLIVSSRPAGLVSPACLGGLPRWEIRPLTKGQCLDFAGLWALPPETRARMSEEFTRSTPLSQLLTVPLVLTAVCRSYRASNKPWPTNSAELWSTIIQDLLAQSHRRHDPGHVTPADHNARKQSWELARSVAWRASGEPSGGRQDTYTTNWLIDRAVELFGSGDHVVRVVEGLVGSALISRHEPERYEFVHRSFAEFLTATVIADLVDGRARRDDGARWHHILQDVDWREVLGGRLWFQRNWDEIAVFTGCVATRPDVYVGWLLSQDDFLWRPLRLALRIARQMPDSRTRELVAAADLPLEIAGEIKHALGPATPKRILEYASSETEFLAAILSPPGTGKTFLMEHLAPVMYERWAMEEKRQQDLSCQYATAPTVDLLDQARHGDPMERAAAASALASRPGDDVVQDLLALIRDPERYVAEAAAEALRQREGAELVEALLELACDELTLEAAAIALAGRDDDRATRAILKGVTRRGWNVDLLLRQPWGSIAAVLKEREHLQLHVEYYRRQEDLIEKLAWASQSDDALNAALKGELLDLLRVWWRTMS